MVSVIIPNYNHAKYLNQRIDSVLNQTFSDFELIILDDNSTDNSREIIESYRNHPKISKVIYNEKNSGSVFKQWEKGVLQAKGDYIWIAESDDWADLSFLDKLTTVLQVDPSIGLIYCNSNIIMEDDVQNILTFSNLRNHNYNTDKWSRSYILEGTKEIQENLIQSCTVNNASAVLFSKKALLKIFPLDKDFKYIGDWYCYLRICKDYKIAYLNETLNFYREHSINASKNLASGLRYVLEYTILFDWILKNLNFIDKNVLADVYLKYAIHNGLRAWNLPKIKLYLKLYKINPYLFTLLFKDNIIKPIKCKTKNLVSKVK
ncbi:glycosyltransferase family 2 protein [Pontibacter vulgaris]|uniref:glycosyltransferase family 2 protein n=1 Tax=Pontibacter vulgaris TaxID=2905679 RepID=UPI001FA6B6CF|nr:glycosyltransferase [Pontibacter vulgaris]